VSLLTDWENFYVIVGSAAAALTGLMFVVITLVAERRNRQSTDGIAAFGTPTVVHFCASLLVAGIVSAPWRSVEPVALLLTLTGLAGIAYVFLIARRARGQVDYQPVLEDWIWHVALPFVAYLAIVVAGVQLLGNSVSATFVIAAAAALLVFIGIHNAWDSVTYLATELLPRDSDAKDE